MIRLGTDELIVDLFAGGGGASQGIFEATGRHPDIAINHDADAVAVHARNHPDTEHYCQSIWQVKPEDACQGRPVGLLWASPDCFPAGTLVLTRSGYVPIERVAIGHEVLTHRLRWRRVVETHRSERPLLQIKGHGHPGLTVSPEHPFLTRKRHDGVRAHHKGYTRCLEDARWTRAAAVDRGTYWATPTVFPPASVPDVPIHKDQAVRIDANLLWLAGRYLAQGWIQPEDCGADLVISCEPPDDEVLRDNLETFASTNGIAWTERRAGQAQRFSTQSRGLTDWLRQNFGRDGCGKTVPAWAMGMDAGLRTAFLEGYLSGAGWAKTVNGVPCRSFQTISKPIVFGLKAIATSLGKTVTVQVAPNEDLLPTTKCKPCWHVMWREECSEAHRQTFRENGMEWTPVRKRIDLGQTGEVFNIGVEDDESYVVEGIVVHNCRHFSRAAGGTPKWKSVRSLPGVVLTWAKRAAPRVIAVENVPEMESWGPLLDDGTPCPDRIGRSFRMWCGRLRGLGYRIEFRKLCAADYGVPTIRTRLFIVARRDDEPIVWPRPTHHKHPSLFEDRWRDAASCIDWSIPAPSIFSRARPLKEATLKRIADGVMRYVVRAEDPFIAPIGPAAHISTFYGTSKGSSAQAPLGAVTAQGEHHALVTAHLMPITHQGPRRGSGMADPVPTLTCANRGEHALITAFLAQHNGGAVGNAVTAPLTTLTARATQQALVEVALSERDTAAAERVTAFLIHYYSNGGQWQDIRAPLGTATTKGRFALVTVRGVPIVDIGMRMLKRHELQAAQGFPSDYDLTDAGRLSKTTSIRLIGNSVCPGVAAAVVRANLAGPNRRSEPERSAA